MTNTTNTTDLRAALVLAEAALSDIGDADREPSDDLAWCEARAAKDLPAIRAAPVKRTVWVNLYGRQLESVCHPTEEDADKHASPNRIGGKAYPLEIEE